MPVVLMLLDGLRPDALTAVNPPHLSAFIARGASTMQARSVDPSVTLPCHMSIFHSVPPSRHGVTDNIYHPPARPITGLVEQLHLHGKRSGLFHNWDPLRDLSRPENLYFNAFVATGYDLDGDAPVVEMFTAYHARYTLDFSFVYFASIDVAGHHFGWMSDGYLEQVAVVDGLVGAALAEIPETTTVLIHADHGGHARTHGTTSDDDMLIPWMIAGPSVRRGFTVERPVSLLDTAPTVAHVLGVPPSPQWEGQAVVEAFAGT